MKWRKQREVTGCNWETVGIKVRVGMPFQTDGRQLIHLNSEVRRKKKDDLNYKQRYYRNESRYISK